MTTSEAATLVDYVEASALRFPDTARPSPIRRGGA